jgi:hypothetical protein
MEWTRKNFGGPLRILAALALLLCVAGSLAAFDVHTAAAQTADDGAPVDVTEIDPGALGSALAGNPVIAYIGVAGVVISFVTSLVTKSTWSKEAKMGVASVLYIAAGAGYWAVEKWQTTEAVLTVLGIATVALVWYRLNHGAMDALRDTKGIT